MANVLTVVWFLIGWITAHTAALIWTALMLPGPVGRARRRIETRPVVSLLLGLAFAVATVVVAGSLVQEGKPGPVQLLGWVLAGPVLAAALIGGAGMAQILAERIQRRQKTDSPLLALGGGALCTTLPALLPILGWFVYLPIVSLIATGAGVHALLSFRKSGTPTEVRAVPAPGEAT